MKMKTSELTGNALDWAVAKAKGYADFVLDAKRFLDMHETGHYNYSTEWAQGGPIIERERLQLTPWPNRSGEESRWHCIYSDALMQCLAYGPTPLIAAMRCFVASKLGDEVEIPDELLEFA